MATLREQLEGKTREERAALKAQWCAELPTRTFTRGGYSVTLSNPQAIGGKFSVFVVVEKNGQEVLRDTFEFVSPRYSVPDGTFHDEFDPATGETMSVPNFREDLVEALKQELLHAIKTQL